MTADSLLRVLHGDVQARCDSTVAQHPDWPCRRGCDLCCRRLANLPDLSSVEWDLVEDGLKLLPAAQLDSIHEHLHQLQGPPFACPFLDTRAGACLIYEHRPLACRTYGFYVDGAEGLYCEDLRTGVEAGIYNDVVWGNGRAIQERSAALGHRTSLTEHFRTKTSLK